MDAKTTNRSVSFNPLSLYEWAADHGAKQEPKQSASAVICIALREYKDRVDPNNTLEAQLLTAGRKMGLPKALDALASHQAKRRRSA